MMKYLLRVQFWIRGRLLGASHRGRISANITYIDEIDLFRYGSSLHLNSLQPLILSPSH